MKLYDWKWGKFLGALLALLLLVVGCGRESTTSDTSKVPTGNLKLNVGQISDSIAFFPLFVAEEEGFFTEEGLTLGERPRLGTGAKLGAALVSGSIDIAAGVITDAFSLAQAGKNPMIIGSLVNNYYVDIVAGKNLIKETGLTKDSPPEAKIKALQGKKIGITGPGSGTEALVVYLFKSVGLDAQKDAELVNLGSDMSAALAALRAERVDALSFFQPIGQLAEAEDIGQIFIHPGRDIAEMEGQVHGVVFTSKDVLQQKNEAVQAFIRGLKRAEAFIHDNPEKTKELLAKFLSGVKPEALDAIVDAVIDEVAVNPEIEQNSYEKAVNFHMVTGLIKTPVEYKNIVDSEIIQQATAPK